MRRGSERLFSTLTAVIKAARSDFINCFNEQLSIIEPRSGNYSCSSKISVGVFMMD